MFSCHIFFQHCKLYVQLLYVAELTTRQFLPYELWQTHLKNSRKNVWKSREPSLRRKFGFLFWIFFFLICLKYIKKLHVYICMYVLKNRCHFFHFFKNFYCELLHLICKCWYRLSCALHTRHYLSHLNTNSNEFLVLVSWNQTLWKVEKRYLPTGGFHSVL